MNHLLFVDDDKELLKINRIYFERRNYAVSIAENQIKAQEILLNQPVDCIILDILMPKMDGYQLCRWMKSNSTAPIIFLTSLTEKECMYRGFDLGGDDYMTKPYELKELECRIHARISQSKGFLQHGDSLVFPPLTLDVAGRKALIDNQGIGLTAYEFDILLLLARSPGKVFSLAEIYREIWKMPDLNSAQTVRVHLARMRHKLEEACPNRRFIELAWGKGFLFRGE